MSAAIVCAVALIASWVTGFIDKMSPTQMTTIQYSLALMISLFVISYTVHALILYDDSLVGTKDHTHT